MKTDQIIADFCSRFFATFSGVLLAGAILLVCTRYYISWEAQRIGDAITKTLTLPRQK